MGIIILDPDPPPKGGGKGKRSASVVAEPNGKWQIVQAGAKVAEFDEYDDAVRYLGHLYPLKDCHHK